MTRNRIGNNKSAYTCNGASCHSEGEREKNDYYATNPSTLIPLLENYRFNNSIREPCCGEGHLSKKLEEKGFSVVSSDLIDRGYGQGGVDFLKLERGWSGDIITNPPYRYAQQFVEKSLDLIREGFSVAMFLKLTFLEGQKRRKLFETGSLKYVLVFSARQMCAKNGEFEKYDSNAIAYAWYIRKKGYKGDTIIKWI